AAVDDDLLGERRLSVVADSRAGSVAGIEVRSARDAEAQTVDPCLPYRILGTVALEVLDDEVLYR
ncbi:MAG: hypothetical protein ACYTBS_21180, partial [Planctomycetota bacterium]